MMNAKRSGACAHELMAGARIPYTAQIAPALVKTLFGDYLQAFRLNGWSFECADDRQLNALHESLNALWRNIASPQLAVWTHVVRRAGRVAELQGEAEGTARSPAFARSFAARYRRRVAAEHLFCNEIYLALLYRPAAGAAGGLMRKILAQTRTGDTPPETADALDVCGKLAQTLLAALARYEPELLGVYRHAGRCCSSLLEYLALLANGEWRRVSLPRGPLNEALVDTRLLFGSEAIEYRTPGETYVGAMLGIKEYPTPSVVGMYDRLLAAPFPLLLTQSFTFLTKSAAQSLLQRQFNRMANAGDFAVSQAEELQQALDALTSNEFVMGDHHFSLQVFARIDPVSSGAAAAGAPNRLKTLDDRVALARSLLADTGMLVAREDLALEAAFWAQLPGNFPLRPRKSPLTSRNFAAMAPFHNYPSGRVEGNHWGEALAVLISAARSPYHFSLHASDPAQTDGGSGKDTGHTLICGPTGSGKTVFIGFLVSLLCRQQVTQIIFDKDQGLEILVRALGGEYLPLQNGATTGFNPLQLPLTAANVEFLKAWLRAIARAPSGSPRASANPVREQADLDQALRGTLALDAPRRRLSRLVEFLDPTDPEGLYARLAPWCAACRGEYAWVFDNPADTVVPRLQGNSVIGFDVTEFLDHEVTRTPVSLYLLHIVRQLLDGRRLVCWIDEFWRLLADPAFECFAKDGPKTWRKLNAVMGLATQSASDVLASPISRTLVEQTPTKVFFPNADADAQEYTQGLGLSEREFLLIKQRLPPGSRQFLVKQGHHSVVCELDLQGFDAELAVISGRRAQVGRLRRIIGTVGADPDAWLPLFLKQSAIN